MKDLDNGAYRNESYIAHISEQILKIPKAHSQLLPSASPGADNVVLLTESRILCFWSNKLRLEWVLPLTQVKGVTVEDTGIRFAHRSGSQHDKFVLIADKSSQLWFFSQVAAVVKSFNARRRMD
jgi:vacuolar protein sorting-associated protein 13A/C